MLELPLPIVTFVLSSVSAGLVWRAQLGNTGAKLCLTLAFALIAIGSLTVGLRFGYGIDRFVWLQRMIPLFVPPALYLGFDALTRGPASFPRKAAIFTAGTLVLAMAPFVRPNALGFYDILIGISYLVYAALLLRLWRRGPDALTHAPLGRSRYLHTWMLAAAGLLLTMFLFDSIIAASFAFQRVESALTFISVASVLSLIGASVTIYAFSRSANAPSPKTPQASVDQAAHVNLEERARDFLTDSQMYLDTNLSLERLAKRLHVPARALSEAINQTQDQNVSQYVNSFRLRHAAQLLETTDLNVTAVMEQSGFLTRSNFYREFERAYRQTPTAFRQAR